MLLPTLFGLCMLEAWVSVAAEKSDIILYPWPKDVPFKEVEGKVSEPCSVQRGAACLGVSANTICYEYALSNHRQGHMVVATPQRITDSHLQPVASQHYGDSLAYKTLGEFALNTCQASSSLDVVVSNRVSQNLKHRFPMDLLLTIHDLILKDSERVPVPMQRPKWFSIGSKWYRLISQTTTADDLEKEWRTAEDNGTLTFRQSVQLQKVVQELRSRENNFYGKFWVDFADPKVSDANFIKRVHDYSVHNENVSLLVEATQQALEVSALDDSDRNWATLGKIAEKGVSPFPINHRVLGQQPAREARAVDPSE